MYLWDCCEIPTGDGVEGFQPGDHVIPCCHASCAHYRGDRSARGLGARAATMLSQSFPMSQCGFQLIEIDIVISDVFFT